MHLGGFARIMPVHRVHAEAAEARRGLQSLWNGIYRTVVSHWELNSLFSPRLKARLFSHHLKKFVVIFLWLFIFIFSFLSLHFCGDLQHLYNTCTQHKETNQDNAKGVNLKRLAWTLDGEL